MKKIILPSLFAVALAGCSSPQESPLRPVAPELDVTSVSTLHVAAVVLPHDVLDDDAVAAMGKTGAITVAPDTAAELCGKAKTAGGALVVNGGAVTLDWTHSRMDSEGKGFVNYGTALALEPLASGTRKTVTGEIRIYNQPDEGRATRRKVQIEDLPLGALLVTPMSNAEGADYIGVQFVPDKPLR